MCVFEEKNPLLYIPLTDVVVRVSGHSVDWLLAVSHQSPITGSQVILPVTIEGYISGDESHGHLDKNVTAP